jgi:hypothetical protein
MNSPFNLLDNTSPSPFPLRSLPGKEPFNSPLTPPHLHTFTPPHLHTWRVLTLISGRRRSKGTQRTASCDKQER